MGYGETVTGSARMIDAGKGSMDNNGSAIDLKLLREQAEKGDAAAQIKLGDCYGQGRGVPLDLFEAAHWYREAAERGDADAQYVLGECYFHGRGVPEDRTEAVRWYRQAAEKRDRKSAEIRSVHAAQVKLGKCFFNGQGVRQDLFQAVHWYRQAAEQGDAHAQYLLGECCTLGTGVRENFAAAVRWYRLAAEQGHADAQNGLGNCYFNGFGILQNETEAARWYRLAARQGHAGSQARLGGMYLNGVGVDRDFKMALAWYRKSVVQGNGEAQARLGYMHEQGLGVDRDGRIAADLYLKSSRRGNAFGQVKLGDCYLAGSGVEQNPRKAFACYLKSAAQDDDPESAALAQLRMGTMYLQGRGVEKDLKEGFEFYKKAARRGNEEAQLCLGAMYRDGVGVKRDLKKAIEWFQKSAKTSMTPAESAMGDLYRDGLVVEKDIDKAMEWYKKAVAKGSKYAGSELLKLRHRERTPEIRDAAPSPSGQGDARAPVGAARMVRLPAGAGVKKDKAREQKRKPYEKRTAIIRGKLQQARKSIGLWLTALKEIPARLSRLAAAGSEKPARKPQVSIAMVYAASAIGAIAISLVIFLLGREKGRADAPESRPAIVIRTVPAPRPELPAVPFGLLEAVDADAIKTGAVKAPRPAKVDSPLPVPDATPGPGPVVPLFRREYRSLDEEAITRMVAARNFFDAQKNPGGGFTHQYKPVNAVGLTLILDRAANLVWSRQQNPVKMNLEKTARWIESLNRVEYGGIRNWRLPTIEEAASLLQKNDHGETICLDGVFGAGIQATWTGDSVSGSESWIVDFREGVIGNAKIKSRLTALMVSSDTDSLSRPDPAQ
jgi:uncharacterized protein